MVDLQLIVIALTVLFGLLGALLFWKSRSSETSSGGRGGAGGGGTARRRAAVPIRDEDGQVRIHLN
jgi:hypothetical protein